MEYSRDKGEWQPFLEYTVVGKPRVKKRPRMGKHGVYTPKVTTQWETQIREELAMHMSKNKIPMICEEPVSAGLYFNRPAGDLDNLVKAVLDAMNKVVYNDDRIVVDLYAGKGFDVHGVRISLSVLRQC